MSYDIELRDPITHSVLELDDRHHMRGGTYCMGGCPTAELNVTYNYSRHYHRVFKGGNGVRSIYGLSGAESIHVLEKAASALGDDIDPDYWKATEGNAKRALLQLLALARMRPDGVWDGD